ncbi:MAG: hypothetical protein MJ041_04115 [Acidaminococcaceae bacterium]|nr:hypothetical protein [Acidaminococcaceae bacterium]
MSEFSLNKEVLAALENCKDAKEIITLAKTRGITLSDEQANRIFSATHGEALTDEEMDMMVGGDLDGKANGGAGSKGCDSDYSYCHERYCQGHCD